MKFEDVPTIECRSCNGSGSIDPTDHLDLDSVIAIRKELVDTITMQSEVAGLFAKDRSAWAREAGRIAWLAGRLSWLLASEAEQEAYAATSPEYTKTLAERRLRSPERHSTPAIDWAEKHAENQPAAA